MSGSPNVLQLVSSPDVAPASPASVDREDDEGDVEDEEGDVEDGDEEGWPPSPVALPLGGTRGPPLLGFPREKPRRAASMGIWDCSRDWSMRL
jgi:hypothetical protein